MFHLWFFKINLHIFHPPFQQPKRCDETAAGKNNSLNFESHARFNGHYSSLTCSIFSQLTTYWFPNPSFKTGLMHQSWLMRMSHLPFTLCSHPSKKIEGPYWADHFDRKFSYKCLEGGVRHFWRCTQPPELRPCCRNFSQILPFLFWQKKKKGELRFLKVNSPFKSLSVLSCIVWVFKPQMFKTEGDFLTSVWGGLVFVFFGILGSLWLLQGPSIRQHIPRTAQATHKSFKVDRAICTRQVSSVLGGCLWYYGSLLRMLHIQWDLLLINYIWNCTWS